MINRHILKISSALLTFGQKLINRITYRLPTSYMYQQLANAQIKKIFIPIPMKVNINFKGESCQKPKLFKEEEDRCIDALHYNIKQQDIVLPCVCSVTGDR